MRYQIYEAKSVKHDAQQRVGVTGKYWQFLHETPCHNCIFQALSPLGLQFGNGLMISKAKSWLIRENQSALFHLSPQNSFQPLRQRHNRWRGGSG